jgi:hypothetical protein
MNQIFSWLRPLALTLIAIATIACAGLETSRKVYVNGEKLGAFGVAGMDAQTGRVLPDGRYWLEPFSGNWGIEGNNTPLGNVNTNGMASQDSGIVSASSGSTSNSVNGTAGTGRDASGNHCAFVSLPNGESVMSCN